MCSSNREEDESSSTPRYFLPAPSLKKSPENEATANISSADAADVSCCRTLSAVNIAAKPPAE